MTDQTGGVAPDYPGRLQIFDMDHTLIDLDCDVSWKEFLVASGIAPAADLAAAARFMADYERGELDEGRFMRFQLRDVIGRTPEEVAQWSRRHFEEVVRPRVRSRALAYVRACRAAGLPTVILTSTNAEIARPVAEFFGVDRLWGTPLELESGRFTGRLAAGSYVGSGKVTAAAAISREFGVPFEAMAAYGDSVNDLPLLRHVGFPHAVNPAAGLRREAELRGWPILDWNAPAD